MANGSFYQGGIPLSGDLVGVGNVPPGAPAPKTAESSYYLGGSVYATLQNSDALLAAITAQQVAATAAATASQASNVASGASAASSAASAAAAAATLAASLLKANNLSDLTNTATARTNIGLGNVDNTSDANKPVSTAQAAADALKANIASPTFTGVAAAPTAAPGTNTTQLASTAFVEAARVILAAADALKAPLAAPALTGTPTAPTAAVNTNTTQLATTAFVLAQAGAANPLMNGSVAVGTATKFAREDHVHASDTSRAPLASPALTGVPTAPTAAGGTNTTQLATTAFVTAAVAGAGVSSIAGNTGAFTLSGLLTNATNDLRVTAAVKADQTTATSTAVAVVPAIQQNHPSAAKAWLYATVSGGVVTNAASYGITSVVRNSVGNFTITLSTAMTSSNYVAMVGHRSSSGHTNVDDIITIGSTTAFTFVHFESATATDPDMFTIVVYGTQ